VDSAGIGSGSLAPGLDASPDVPDKRRPPLDAAVNAGDAAAPDGSPVVEDAPADAAIPEVEVNPTSADAGVIVADAALEIGPSPTAARCEKALSAPLTARRLLQAPRSDDITFDHQGRFLSFNGRDIVFMDPQGNSQVLASNLIGTKGGALRALPDGEIFIADYEGSRVFVRDPAGQVRQLPAAVNNPMKMVRGPGGTVYVTNKQGAITRIKTVDGAVTTVATTDFEVGGLAFSPDHRTLYVGAISANSVQAFDVLSDGSLGPPRLWRSQVPRAQALATDECGSIYVVSEGDNRIRRLRAGGGVDIVADPAGVFAWSLSFGSGSEGWSAQSLFVHEATGRLFEIALPYAGKAPPDVIVE
jgi:DNA-binding beta-propeller fold protein YncE